MDCSVLVATDAEIEGDLEDLSPFDIDWGIVLPKQSDADDRQGADTPRIDEDDYNEDEAAVLKALKTKIRDACNVNTSWPKRKKALHWCFSRDAVDKNGLDFHSACIALGARPDVIQARLHHQMYVAGVPLKEPMPAFWLAALPEQYVSEAIMAAWEEGLAIAQQIWAWPGIPLDVLEEQAGQATTFEALQKLERAGLVAWRFGCVFLTGRSEQRVKTRNFSWSKSFF